MAARGPGILLALDDVKTLADALEKTFASDPDLYYEDAYQLLADQRISTTGRVAVVMVPPGRRGSWNV